MVGQPCGGEVAAGGFGFVRQVFGGDYAAAVFLGRCGQIKRGNAVRRAEFDNVFRTFGQGLHIQECALLRDDGDVFVVEIGFVFARPAAAFAQQFGQLGQKMPYQAGNLAYGGGVEVEQCGFGFRVV